MSNKVAMLIADGTEPIEALAPIDILRRGGVDAQLISIMGPKVVLAHNIIVEAEGTINDIDLSGYDMIVVPGGSVGVENLGACEPVRRALAQFMQDGRFVASICAGPMILAELGLLAGRTATCYPGCEGGFPQGAYVEGPTVVVDDNLITASGPGVALDFGVALLRALKGDALSDGIAGDMLMRR